MLRLVSILILVPSFALAGKLVTPNAANPYPELPGNEFFCTGSTGERYEIGEVICIAASCQVWMAKCERSNNLPMWRKTMDGCPGASLFDRFRQTEPALMSSPKDYG